MNRFLVLCIHLIIISSSTVCFGEVSSFSELVKGRQQKDGLVLKKDEALEFIKKAAYQKKGQWHEKVYLTDESRLFYDGESINLVRSDEMVDLKKFYLLSPGGGKIPLLFNRDILFLIYEHWGLNGGGRITYDGKSILFSVGAWYYAGQTIDDKSQIDSLLPEYFDMEKFVFGSPTEEDRASIGMLACMLHSEKSCSYRILSQQSYGDVVFGSKLARVESTLGDKASREPGGEACEYVTFNKYPGISFMVEDGILTRADVQAPSILNVLGIKIGASFNDVMRLYPEAVVRSHQYDDDGHYIIFKSKAAKYAIVLEESQGKITRIRAGLEPSVEYVEGCL